MASLMMLWRHWFIGSLFFHERQYHPSKFSGNTGQGYVVMVAFRHLIATVISKIGVCLSASFSSKHQRIAKLGRAALGHVAIIVRLSRLLFSSIHTGISDEFLWLFKSICIPYFSRYQRGQGNINTWNSKQILPLSNL